MTTEEADGRPATRVTMSDVAAALEVAVSTVSNAYNRPDQLSAELRARILATAEALGYPGPDPVARSLRQQRAGAVGVLFAERLQYAFRDPAALLVLEGVASALEPEGLGLLLVPGRHDDLTTIQRALVDGFIVYSMMEDDPLVTAALGRKLPTVLLDQPPRADVPSITVDDVDGARQAAAHLLGLGHRRLAIVAARLREGASGGHPAVTMLSHEEVTATFFFTQRRFQGYRRAIEGAGLSWEAVTVVSCADNGEDDGAAAMVALLAAPSPPTAVLCLTDRLALGAMAAAQQRGLAIPDEISIVGFDDIPAAATAEPPLTTVRQAHRDKGRLAGQALIGQMEGAVAEQRTLPVTLIVRGSTGPAPRR